MKPQLVLMRVVRRLMSPNSNNLASLHPQSFNSVDFTGIVQWDTNHPFHLGALETRGILQTYMLETSGGGSKAYLYPCTTFQLHLSFGSSHLTNQLMDKKVYDDDIVHLCFGHDRQCNEDQIETKPIEKAWGSFEFIPHRPGEIVFFQVDSSQILFAQLPGGSPRCLHIGDRTTVGVELDRSKVYCVGRHSSTIFSIAVRQDGLALASAAKDGYIRIWKLLDGSMIAQTLFSCWRQPCNPKQQTHISPLLNPGIEDVMNIVWPTLRVISFFGDSWDLVMGCPNGEVKIWSMQSERTPSTITEVGSVISNTDTITSLALHVPNYNFPVHLNHMESKDCSPSHAPNLQDQELLAIGTMNGKLQVWTKHNLCHEWILTWSITPSIEGFPIVCLSFRADGGLLAVAISMLKNNIEESFDNESVGNSLPKQMKHANDYLYLYNTSSWVCVGSLRFTSKVGSCLFYYPCFNVEDQDDPKRCVSRAKVSSCRMLLVSTSNGPQTHILPEYGLFGYIHAQCDQSQITPLNYRREGKTVHWANFNRRRRGLQLLSQQKKNYLKENENCQSKIDGEGDGSGPRDCKSIGPLLSELDGASNPMQKKVLPLGSPSSSPCRLRSSTNFQPNTSQVLQNSSLKCSQGSIGSQGLRKARLQRFKSKVVRCPPSIKTRTDFCISKEIRSTPLKSNLLPMGHKIINQLISEKQLYSKRPMYRQRQNRSQLPKNRHHGSSLHSHLPPSNAHIRKKIKKEWQQDFSNDISNDKDSCSIAKNDVIIKDPSTHDEIKKDNGKNKNSHSNATIDFEIDPLVRSDPLEKVDALQKQTFLPSQEKEHNDFDHPQNSFTLSKQAKVETNAPKQIRGQNVKKTFSRSSAFLHPRAFQGKENIRDTTTIPIKFSCNSKNKVLGNIKENTLEYTKKMPRKKQERDVLGTYTIGGEELDELLAMNEVSLPLIKMARVGHTFKSKYHSNMMGVDLHQSQLTHCQEQCKLMLDRPKAFSTSNLMQHLQQIEQETFDIEAAIKVAEVKGLTLSKNDKQELKKALEKEEQQAWSPQSLELEGRKSSARYVPLLKISDPRVTHNGPFLGARKSRKHKDTKREDKRTIQPAILDLWDLRERCPQISSLQHANTCWAMNWRKSLGSYPNGDDSWKERDATWRAVASAQAIYDSCLYRPSPDEPTSNCTCA